MKSERWEMAMASDEDGEVGGPEGSGGDEGMKSDNEGLWTKEQGWTMSGLLEGSS